MSRDAARIQGEIGTGVMSIAYRRISMSSVARKLFFEIEKQTSRVAKARAQCEGAPMTPEDSKGSATIESETDPRGLAEMATHSARSLAEEGKESTARQMGTVATAIRGAARELQGQMPKGAEIIRSAATTLESSAERLRQRSVDEWLVSLKQFAHDEPAMLFGGAILAGFAFSRFLNSSRPSSRAGEHQS